MADVARWQSIDKRMQFRSGAVELPKLGELVERRFKAGDRELVAFCDGREVGWINRVSGRRTYSYEKAQP